MNIPKIIPMAVVIAIVAGSTAVGQEVKRDKQIYFGDLHTHTNLSADAVVMQLAHGVERGPEAACMYAAACAQVDFYGQSDHAEMTDIEDWQRIQAAVTSCNEMGRTRAGEGQDPTIVAFQGFEWTSGMQDIYWGHKNVFFRSDAVPELPIASGAIGEIEARRLKGTMVVNRLMKPLEPTWGQRWRAFKRAVAVNGRERCEGMEVEPGCIRVANEPRDLFALLNGYYDQPGFVENGYDTMVIPHGTAWGMAKVGTDWDIQLNSEQHDPSFQTLIEVYSGHGNSEEYRDFERDDSGYQSCADRAAELTREYCQREEIDAGDCDEDIERALATGQVDFDTVPGDWGHCGQCTDCYQPAERYQPDGSVQAAMARSSFDENGDPELRYRFGFIAATDDHAGKPASVMEDRSLADWGLSVAFQGAFYSSFVPKGRNRVEAERLGSFFYPGGLVAIHADGRTRDQLWTGLKNREVYGTSGPRIQLWFDALAGDQRVPMGGQVSGTTAPQFEVTAIGAQAERPGCSDQTVQTWGADVVQNHCAGVCFNPGDERVGIDRVEVVRIRPQTSPTEQVGDLIDDPWKVIVNADRDESGKPTPVFTTQFSDPEFSEGQRDALYYVRAIQVPTDSVNGVPLQDDQGDFTVCPLYNLGDNAACMTKAGERAWSSPIFVDFIARP